MIQTKAGGKEPANKLVIENRLQNRERRMKTKDVYEQQEETIELLVDYPKKIKDTREALGWKQEELASKMGERLSIINKLERGDMRPDDALIDKVEKALGIKITERVAVMKPEKGRGRQGRNDPFRFHQESDRPGIGVTAGHPAFFIFIRSISNQRGIRKRD